MESACETLWNEKFDIRDWSLFIVGVGAEEKMF